MNYKLYHGDCLEVMNIIPDKSIDMILCDLPYGTTACKWDVVIPFEPLWKQYERIIKDNGAIVLFGCNPFTAMLIVSNLKLFKYTIVWNKVSKTDFMNAKNKPLRQHEDLMVFSKGTVANCSKKLMKYNPQGIKPGNRSGKQTFAEYTSATKGKRPCMKDFYETKNSNYPTSIITFSNANRTRAFFPTQKPVPLLEYLIKTYTDEGKTVLDNCMGSGSTGEAALNTGRFFIGIEKDDYIFEIAKKRIEDLN
jgi:site-specific DNA-methyltransferase (adenine-specific)